MYPDLCTDASVGQEKIRRFYAEFAGVGLNEVPGSEVVYWIAQKAFYLDLDQEMDAFLRGYPRTISVPFTDKEIDYDASPRIGVGISKLGASEAIALGAYVFAVSRKNS